VATGLTPSQRATRARIGGYALHASVDSREHTERARAKFLDRFVVQVDPDRVLSERERARRAEAALKAYMTQLAFRSARSRRERSGRTDTASSEQLDAEFGFSLDPCRDPAT
jgi:hypothetical protein